MMVTIDDLQYIYSIKSVKNIKEYLPIMNQKFEEYKFTVDQICMFIAQIGHESGRLVYTEELASGVSYEGRKDLGNIYSGDGVRYKGRGLIQITGRSNYQELSNDTGIDYINNPSILKNAPYCVTSAFWYWMKKNLNKYVDGTEKGLKLVTKKINGGYNGYEERKKFYFRALERLSKVDG